MHKNKRTQRYLSSLLALLLSLGLLAPYTVGASEEPVLTDTEMQTAVSEQSLAETSSAAVTATPGLNLDNLADKLDAAASSMEQAKALAAKITANEEQYVNDKAELEAHKDDAALLNLLKQSDGRYKDGDSIKILVEPRVEVEILANIGSDAASEAKLQAHAATMTDAKRADEKSIAQASQDKLIAALQEAHIKFELGNERLYFLLNAFTVTTTFAEAKKIATFPGVAGVDIMRQYRMTPEMQNSVNIINAPQVWHDYGYKGEGMVVSVIDSGIDPEHEAMRLSDPGKVKLTKADADKVIHDLDIRTSEGYFNAKVPFAMALQLDHVKEANRVSHGMHVAGTIAGNYEGPDKTFKGVAPEAQVIAFNVFNFLGGTGSELYLTALEYSYALRADAINMSLGKSVGTEQGVDPAVSKALQKLATIGTVVAISAGNDGTTGYELRNPAAENMDYGVVADPSLVSESLSVAALENTKLTSKSVDFSGNGEEFSLSFKDSDNSTDFVLQEPTGIVFAGKGYAEDYANIDVSGKVVLVERGEISFEEKADNALASVPKSKPAPKLIIFYNNVSDSANAVSMAKSKLVGISIGKADGERVKAALAQDPNLQVKLTGEESVFDNPKSGSISDFSSWGPTPNYGMKPEITAPGGRIVSSINSENGKSYYSDMSGTSMSSPHVTGAVALLKEKLMKERNLSNRFGETPDAAVMTTLKHDIKNILMSTAHPHVNAQTGAMSSPRQQGAGVLDILAAVKAEAYLYNPANTQVRESKVNLRDIKDQVDFAVGIHNFGSSTLNYTVSYTVQTDLIENGYNTLTPKNLLKGDLGAVSVAPGSDKELNVSFNLASVPEVQAYLQALPKGGHVDGFVIFTPDDNSGPELSIPFMGFYGEWLKLPMAEQSIYELKKTGTLPAWQAFSNEEENAFTHLYTNDYDRDNNIYYRVLGTKDNFNPKNVDFSLVDGDKIAISPNGDGSGDNAILRTNMFRNYQIDVEILNEQGEVIERPYLGPATYGTKNYKYGKVSTGYTFWRWDGDRYLNDDYVNVPDGKYLFRAILKPDVMPELFGLSSADQVPAQNYDFPIYVDTKAPQFKSVVRNGQQVSVTAEDQGVGIMGYVFTYGNKAIHSDDGSFTLPADWDYAQVKVAVKDWALNMTTDLLSNIETYVDNMGSIAVSYTFKDKLRARRIDLTFKNKETGKLYYNAGKLPFGTYEVYTDNLPYEIQLEPRMQEVTLTADAPHADIKFIVKDEDVSLGYVFLRVKKPGSYFDRLRPYVIDENGKRVLLQLISEDKSTSTETYRAKVLFGKYHLIFEELNPGFTAYPNDMDIEVSEEQDADLNVVIMREGQFGKIIPKLVNEAGASEEAVAKIKWVAHNEDKDIVIPRLEEALYGSYSIELRNLPENTYTDPAIGKVVVDASNLEVEVTMTLKSNVGTKASLKIVNNFEDKGDAEATTTAATSEEATDLTGADPTGETIPGHNGDTVINSKYVPNKTPKFELKDVNGKVYTDYDNLPYGIYELRVKEFPAAYAPEEYFSDEYEEFLPKVRKIILDAEHPQAEEVYNWKYLLKMQKEGNLYIRPIMNRSEMKEVFHFKITNSKGEVKTYTYAAAGYFTDAIILPYDTYTIEPINMKKGIVAQPQVMNIALTTSYHIVRFTYKGNGEIEKYPQPTEGPGIISVKMPVAQTYAYAPSLALYDYHNKLIAKTDFDMELLGLEATLSPIPEGDYLLSIEDCGDNYVPIPRNVPVSIRDNPYERYHPFRSMNIYPLYHQSVNSVGDVPQGIEYRAYAKLGDFEQTFGILKKADGEFTRVPEGHEYFIEPVNVPEGYVVYPPVQRINYFSEYLEGEAIEKPEVKFEYFKLENGVNTALLERAMAQAKYAVDTEAGVNGTSGNVVDNASLTTPAISTGAVATGTAEHVSAAATTEMTALNADLQTAAVPLHAGTEHGAPEDGSEIIKDRTSKDFIMPKIKDSILQDPGKVYLSADYLAYEKNDKSFKGFYIPYGEFKSLYDEITTKLSTKAYTKQEDVDKDYAALRHAVSHLQKKMLTKQARQVMKDDYDQATEPGESYVKVFVYPHPLWGNEYFWNVRLVDYFGREYYPEWQGGRRGVTYMFKNLPRGEYSLQLFNNNDMVNLPQEWNFALTGNKESFEFINSYIREYIRYPLQAITFDPTKADENYDLQPLPFADTHYDITYNMDRMNFKVSDLEKGPEGRDEILEYFGDAGWDYIMDRDINDNCRIDFVATAPLYENFRIYPKQVPAGYRVVNFVEERGITEEKDAKAIKFYYVRDDRTELPPKEQPFVEGEGTQPVEPSVQPQPGSETQPGGESQPSGQDGATPGYQPTPGKQPFYPGDSGIKVGKATTITLPNELNHVIGNDKVLKGSDTTGVIAKNGAVMKTGEQKNRQVSLLVFTLLSVAVYVLKNKKKHRA